MCGIAGITHKDQEPSPEEKARLSSCIAHRGPDNQDSWQQGGTYLAHARLAIIDTSETGAQPMESQNGRYSITYNGELYNYKEIRKQLQEQGIVCKGKSDTEVLLESYALWKEACFTKLEGMFACAIWDKQEKRLLLARDAQGEKPLYYHHTDSGSILFSSEIQGIQKNIHAPIDTDLLRTFVGLQYIPAPHTGFVGICQLMPGTYGTWHDGLFTETTYHTPETYTGEKSPQALRELLTRAVRSRQLTSDVPMGAFLSSGIDSAAVVALASQEQQLQTFTMGFDDSDFDERAAAEKLAKKYNSKHHSFRATSQELRSITDEVIAHYASPYADSSALPVWLLAKRTKEHVKVVLTGDGSDEFFGGYRRYMFYNQALALSKLPLQQALTTCIKQTGKVLKRSDLVRMSQVIEACKHSPERGYATLFTGSYFNQQRTQNLFKRSWLEETKEYDATTYIENKIRSYKNQDPLAQAMSFDQTSYLPDDLLVKMDRATMRWGLEARAPFLDSKVQAFARSLTSAQHTSYTDTKLFLKRSLEGVLPREVLTRKKKGFQVPLASWFRKEMAEDWKERCLGNQSPLASISNQKELELLFKENLEGVDHGNRLWLLYSLATWLDTNKAHA